MDQFAAKLSLALKAHNISRGRLASTVGVDKSVISRWLGGHARPSGHNLTLITDAIRREREDFSLLTWELPLSAFASALGVMPSQDLTSHGTSAAVGLALATISVSRANMGREAHVYPGIYMGYRQAFANNGIVVAQALMLRLEGDALAARSTDGFFHHRGEALLLSGQLFIVIEDETRLDEVVLIVLNGVSARMARVLDGLTLGIAGDRACTPSAMGIVFQRAADLTGDDDADQALWAETMNRVLDLNIERRARQDMPAAFAEVVDNLVGTPRPSGAIDYVLRVPFDRSLSADDTLDP